VAQTAAGIGAAIAGTWRGLARTVGATARATGRQAATARDLDPAHRRDGVGLAILGVALVAGVSIWAGAGGPAGQGLAAALRLGLGNGALAVPVLLAILGCTCSAKRRTPNSGAEFWSASSPSAPPYSACSTSGRTRPPPTRRAPTRAAGSAPASAAGSNVR
jgi:hypothetical protein